MSWLQDTWITSEDQHRGILWFWYVFFIFDNWSPFTTIVWEITATSFFCDTPAVFCGIKNFIQPSIGIQVSSNDWNQFFLWTIRLRCRPKTICIYICILYICILHQYIHYLWRSSFSSSRSPQYWDEMWLWPHLAMHEVASMHHKSLHIIYNWGLRKTSILASFAPSSHTIKCIHLPF